MNKDPDRILHEINGMPSSGKSDIETGTSRSQYPMMTEFPELRWGFIRKVYAILTIQLLLSVAVGVLFVKFHPIATFLTATTAGIVYYVILLIISFICKLFVLMFSCNYVLLAVFTASLALATGPACSSIDGNVILEVVILTTVVVVSLTLFTFWVQREILIPMGKLADMIYGGISALVFCGYIVFDIFNLIKLYTYDDYILAAIALYLDVLNLFLALLIIFSNILATLRRI